MRQIPQKHESFTQFGVYITIEFWGFQQQIETKSNKFFNHVVEIVIEVIGKKNSNKSKAYIMNKL